MLLGRARENKEKALGRTTWIVGVSAHSELLTE